MRGNVISDEYGLMMIVSDAKSPIRVDVKERRPTSSPRRRDSNEDREVAWRVFAGEFNSSRLEIKGEGEKVPSYLVTPLGGDDEPRVVGGRAH